MILVRSSSSYSRRRVVSVCAALAVVASVSLLPAAALGATFSPNKVMSDGMMRANDSMSSGEVQAFLDAKGGVLRTLVTADHTGKRKRASAIIWEACQYWHISPAVMLTLLQKEQTLITRTSASQRTLDRAIGAGCPSSNTNKYPGFGNQMWNGARLLDGYGEANSTSYVQLFHRGITVTDIYQHPNVTVTPANVATYKLYIYNPSIGAKKPYGDLSGQSSLGGNAAFWRTYSTWFGNPTADSGRQVYRFVNRSNGTYFYTTSLLERYALIQKSGTWKYQGATLTWNPNSRANGVPVYRFRNKKTGGYLFTPSATQYKTLRSASGAKKWAYEGIAFTASRSRTGAAPVYAFANKNSGLYFFTASAVEKAKFASWTYRNKGWVARGIGFWMTR
jgi:Repeat of unknown function (DUF5648)